jgi:PEP-CTERM motif
MFSKVTMISMFRSTALAAIAAGLALTSPAHANMISNFSGTCTALCTGSTSGVLTLTDAYVPGTNIILQPATFVSFLYQSNDTRIFISGANPCDYLAGSIAADGSVGFLILQGGPLGFGLPVFQDEGGAILVLYQADNGQFTAPGSSGNPELGTGSFGPLVEVPEPASLTLLAVGLAGLGMVLRTRRV